MSERIYILDERGNVCGIEDRNFVHNNGILHLAVQCWLINESREVLIQRRSAKKDRSPGKRMV